MMSDRPRQNRCIVKADRYCNKSRITPVQCCCTTFKFTSYKKKLPELSIPLFNVSDGVIGMFQ